MKFLYSQKFYLLFCLPFIFSSFTEQKEFIKNRILLNQTNSAAIYPGCKGTNEELKKCFHQKLSSHIASNFNKKAYENIGLSPGKKKIYCKIKITKTGSIEILEIKAPHKNLEYEAKRVLNLLPKVTPENQFGKPVETLELIPISFNVK